MFPTLLPPRPQEHTGRVFRLQFDEFQIVSSSHDDSILIWDFLNYTPPPSSSGAGQEMESEAAEEGQAGLQRAVRPPPANIDPSRYRK